MFNSEIFIINSTRKKMPKSSGLIGQPCFTPNLDWKQLDRPSADFTQTEFGGDSGAVRLFGIGVQYDF